MFCARVFDCASPSWIAFKERRCFQSPCLLLEYLRRNYDKQSGRYSTLQLRIKTTPAQRRCARQGLMGFHKRVKNTHPEVQRARVIFSRKHNCTATYICRCCTGSEGRSSFSSNRSTHSSTSGRRRSAKALMT